MRYHNKAFLGILSRFNSSGQEWHALDGILTYIFLQLLNDVLLQ